MRRASQSMAESSRLFSNQDLRRLIVPLFLEQLLLALVGILDVFVVGFVGEAAVSGVSLVNSFNTIFINLFTALAAGGAVVISQYIGRRDQQNANRSSSQLLISSVIFSGVVSIIVLIFYSSILHFLFGSVEQDVMEACITYIRISAYSYPAIAIYSAGAALYRSFGDTKTTMNISIVSNGINVVGNCIGVFVLGAGVAGVAWPSMISRTFSALWITVLCFSKANPVYYLRSFWIDSNLQKTILKIAVPNGIESGIFQFVKVALSSVVSLFGTYQIAANGVAQSIWSVAALVCVAMGPAFITVIGQCMGAGDIEQADYYFKKLLKINIVFATVWNIFIFLCTPLLMMVYPLQSETKYLVIVLVLIHNVFSATAFPFADPLGKGLRATGDVAFTTIISLFTTIGVRLVFSYIFAIGLNMGVIGIAIAMSLDWCIRGIIYWIRYKQGKWKTFQVLAAE